MEAVATLKFAKVSKYGYIITHLAILLLSCIQLVTALTHCTYVCAGKYMYSIKYRRGLLHPVIYSLGQFIATVKLAPREIPSQENQSPPCSPSPMLGFPAILLDYAYSSPVSSLLVLVMAGLEKKKKTPSSDIAW